MKEWVVGLIKLYFCVKNPTKSSFSIKIDQMSCCVFKQYINNDESFDYTGQLYRYFI